MKLILLVLLNGCLLMILGCASAPVKTDTIKTDTIKTDDTTTDTIKTDSNISYTYVSVAGKYFNPLSPVIYIELKDDGTFDDRFGKRSTTGKYVIDGNRVIFTPKSGNTYEYMIDGNSLVYKDGGKLNRK
jgi:hypothetical protein